MNKEQPSTLVLLSGGIHSLLVLIDLLENSNQKICAHHVRIKARDFDNSNALKSCQQMVDYCILHYRQFGFSQSMLDYHDLFIQGAELSSVIYHASIAAYCNLPVEFGRCVMAANERHDPAYLELLANCYKSTFLSVETPRFKSVYVNRETAQASIPIELQRLIADQEADS